MTKLYTRAALNVSRIAHIKRIDKGDTIPLNNVDRRLYCFLDTLGFIYGYGNIYPSIKTIADQVGAPERTINNSLNKLEKIKLISRSKVKQVGAFDSNRYQVFKPYTVPRVMWLDRIGSELVGSEYNFNPDIYKKRG